MSTAPHRIRRQSWLVRAGSAAEGFRLRAEVREAWESVLLPSLERAFDEAAAGDRVIRIPRLELRLRLDSVEELVAELPRLVREAVGDRLRAIEEQPRAMQTASARQSRLETVLHYLRTGGLPWQAAGGPRQVVLEELRSAAVAELPALIRALPAAPEPEAFAFRLIQLLDEGGVAELIALAPVSATLPARVLEALASSTPREVDASARHTRLEAASVLLAHALSVAPLASVSEVRASFAHRSAAMRDVLERTLMASETHASIVVTGSSGEPVARHDPPLPTSGAKAGVGPRQDSSTEAKPRAGRKPQVEHSSEPVDELEIQGEATAAVTQDSPSESDPEPQRIGLADHFGSMVCSAGLVLLHPFLAPLLEETGLSRDGRIAPESLPRAAALLHYLATGREEPLEFELGLAKLLLGLDPGMSLLVAAGLLGDADREEADALLRAAIGHWRVLKGTSPDGLRVSFLERPGLLRREEESWSLRVETASIDLLLDHLPWGISIVRMPWMPEPLYIEWPSH